MNSLSWRTRRLPRNNFHRSQPLPAAIRKTNAKNANATTGRNVRSRLGEAPRPIFWDRVRVAAVRVSESAPLRKPSFGSAERIFR